MKKSHSSHIDPFRSPSLSSFPKRSPTAKNSTFHDPLSRTTYFKPSSFTFTSYAQRHKNLREAASNSTVSKTLLKNPPKTQTAFFSTNDKKPDFQAKAKKTLRSKESNRISERDFTASERKSLDLELDDLGFEGSSVQHSKPHVCCSAKSVTRSNAYAEAMRALQGKIKQLEEENNGLKQSFQEFQRKIEEEIEKRLTEKSNLFLRLELNLKAKLMDLEMEKKVLEQNCADLRSDVGSLQERLRFFEEKASLDFKEFLQEKSELKRHLLSSQERAKRLEEQNRSLMKARDNILKDGDLLNNYENTFQLLHKQNEVLKVELQKNFHQASKSLSEKPALVNGNVCQSQREMRSKLEEREKEIDFLKEQFQDLLLKNELKIIQKENTERPTARKALPGSLKKQKSREIPEYKNKTLEKMINNIISVNSSKKGKEEPHTQNINTTKENVYFSNSVESIKQVKASEDDQDDSIKFVGINTSDAGSNRSSEEIKKLESELADLMDKYSAMSNQICENRVNFKDMPKLKKEMKELNNLINQINQELIELKLSQRIQPL